MAYLSLLFTLFLSCLLPHSIHAQTQFPIVSTPLGQVQGVLTGNNNVNAYIAVPYAQPPLGELRFAYPQPVQPWNTTWNATQLSPYPLCVQPNISIGTEDCLYVDVYTPATVTPNSKLPVIVCICLHVYMYSHAHA
jgi:carboxylesterase type B